MGRTRTARTRTAPVVDHGSWIANSWDGLRVAVLCGAGLRVAVLCSRGLLVVLGCEFVIWVAGCRCSWIVGCAGLRIRDMGCGLRLVVDRWLCSVVLGCGWLFRFLGWRDMVLGGCFTVVLVFGSVMERQRWETETRDERQRRESQIKYYYFFTILATVQFSNADDFGT